jgi:hypothetical protein
MTSGVGADVADVEPPAFCAITETRMLWPRSAPVTW